MDLSEKDKFGLEKSSGDNLNYHTPRMSSEWRFDGGNLVNPQLGMVPTENSKGDQMGPSACSSVSMGDSFCPNLWDHPPSQNLGFCENNVQTSTSTSNIEALRKSAPGSSRSPMEKELDMGWNPSMSKGGLFLQTGLPQSLSQFPTDSAFIERAARYSCFNGGNFVDMVSSFTDMVNPFSTVGGGIQAPEVSTGNSFKAVSGAQSQKNESHMAELVNDVSLSIDHGGTEGSPMKTDREAGNLLRLSEEGKRGMGVSSNESDEAEFSGGGGQEEPSFLENAAKELSAKKRKRSNQEIELEQSKGTPQFSVDTAKENTETKHKGEQNTPPATTRPTGKHAKDSSQNSDVPKEDYIHVRARRGQATNSHSLAERVRRERISERMKFLQDLVPGCSKVTGKAVMLDEIINYVQSLQRQVEFLSMKLATVNPRMEFNLEGLLSKDILQSRGGTPSTIGFSPDMSMPHPHLHQSQSGLIQAGIPGIGNPPDSLRRAITSQLTAMNGYREPAPQMPPGVWDDELHNVVQMSFGPNAPFNTQELTGSLPPGHMKVEL